MYKLRQRTLHRPLVFSRKFPPKLQLRQANTNVTLLSAGRLKAWAIEGLPKGCNADDTFKLVASPMYLQILGHNKMPFVMPDDEDLKGMQAIFNSIYQSLQEYTIQVGSNCLVFGMVCCCYSGVYNCLIMYLVPFWCQQPSQYSHICWMHRR